jgi:tripeptidyl-peptidase-1
MYPDPEVAASFSGGGFSDYFERPYYQENAVSDFLDELGDHYAGLYNRSGRGYPDIAALATEFSIVLNDNVRSTGGTLCALSTVAGIVSLMNDFLISKRKAPLGFLNPWLYDEEDGLAEGLNDITYGSNQGCGTGGFLATPGWDPVTGLGMPDFRKLLNLVIAQLKID